TAPIPPWPINLIGSTPFPCIALASNSTEGGHKVSVSSAGRPFNACFNRHFGHKSDTTAAPPKTNPHCGHFFGFTFTSIYSALRPLVRPPVRMQDKRLPFGGLDQALGRPVKPSRPFRQQRGYMRD